MRNSRLAGGLAALAVLLVLLVSAPVALADVDAHPVAQPGAVAVAQRYLGAPYLAGGASAKGVSTPGFTKLVYRRSGMWLPVDRGGSGPARRRHHAATSSARATSCSTPPALTRACTWAAEASSRCTARGRVVRYESHGRLG